VSTLKSSDAAAWMLSSELCCIMAACFKASSPAGTLDVAGGLYNIALGVQYNMTNLNLQFVF